jgi:hypothetical protein
MLAVPPRSRTRSIAEDPMRSAVALLVLASLAFPAAVAPQDDAEAATSSLSTFLADVENPAAKFAVGWAHFQGEGFRHADDCFGDGAAPQRARAEAIEPAVKKVLEEIAGKKTRFKLNDAVDLPIASIGETGITVRDKKTETLVPWADIDGRFFAILIARAKPTDEPTLAAVAMLRFLDGELGEIRRQAKQQTGEIGKALTAVLDDAKTLEPEVKAARALESALRAPDAGEGLQKLAAAWPEAKASKVGEALKKHLRAQYVRRGERAFAGKAALEGLIHGKVTVNPAKAAPAAGPGGVGMEIEYEFEKDAEGADFDPGDLPIHLQNLLRRQGGSMTAEPLKVTQSRLMGGGNSAGILPLEFAGDLEIESVGGLSPDFQGGKPAILEVGCSTDDGRDLAVMTNQSSVDVVTGGRPGGSQTKNITGGPGSQWDSVMKVGAGAVTLTVDGEALKPVAAALKPGLRVWVVAAPRADWYIERLVIRGTATGASMTNLAHVLAEKRARELFGE